MTVNPHSPTCTWDGCAAVANHPMFARDGERWAFLCDPHKKKFDEAGLQGVRAVLAAWVKAQGGAKKAVIRMGPRCAITDGIGNADDADGTDDNPYCECGAVHSGIEDCGICEACGKII